MEVDLDLACMFLHKNLWGLCDVGDVFFFFRLALKPLTNLNHGSVLAFPRNLLPRSLPYRNGLPLSYIGSPAWVKTLFDPRDQERTSRNHTDKCLSSRLMN
jgi:hypothetical protein